MIFRKNKEKDSQNMARKKRTQGQKKGYEQLLKEIKKKSKGT